MEPRVYTDYELVEPVSNKRYVTESRVEAQGYFDKEWIVIERQITCCRYSLFDEAQFIVRMNWNNNPDFTGE